MVGKISFSYFHKDKESAFFFFLIFMFYIRSFADYTSGAINSPVMENKIFEKNTKIAEQFKKGRGRRDSEKTCQ